MEQSKIIDTLETYQRFIQHIKGTCKQPLMIIDLDNCVQCEDESAHHWVQRVSTIMHSSDSIAVGQAVLVLEKNCHFTPPPTLKQKLGWLKCHCNDMGELMAALIKYANSNTTKDPGSDDEKSNKGKQSGNGKGWQQNVTGHNDNNEGNGGKCRQLDGGSDLVANTNTGYKNQHRNGNGKRSFGGKNFNIEDDE